MQRLMCAVITALCLTAAAPADAGDRLVLQLKWLPDAQFAGYFVAEAKGFYRDAGLDVTIQPGAPTSTRRRSSPRAGPMSRSIGWPPPWRRAIGACRSSISRRSSSIRGRN